MERGSDKHNPRIDEDLDHLTASLQEGAPVESRAEEFREQEGGDDTDPTPDALLQGGNPDHDAIEARSQLARFVRPSAFPGDRDALLGAARDEQAPSPVLTALGRLPEGRSFENVEQVWEALGGTGEEQRF